MLLLMRRFRLSTTVQYSVFRYIRRPGKLDLPEAWQYCTGEVCVYPDRHAVLACIAFGVWDGELFTFFTITILKF